MATSRLTNRSIHRPEPDRVTVRESDSDTFAVRMPVASTGEVRNEGDDPLTREEIGGMAQQIADSDIGVFPQHGSSNVVDGDRYSQFQRLGDWTDAELQSEAAADGSDLLMATAEMPDPDTVSEATGEYRQMLAILKEQAERGIGINSSIGWADDEDAPGGVDLLEVSIVGIGADPRTNTETDEAAGLVARSAVAAGADPDDLLARVERALVDATNDTVRVDVDGTEVDLSPPEAVVNACEAGLSAKDEYDTLSDCGTGDGEESATRIIEGDLTAEYVADEIAAYLTSHADDVDGIDSPPTEWDESTWTDGCGPVQYTLWGGTATGTGLQWAQTTANAVAEAKGEEIPYPEARNLDDPEFSEGDAVRWTWDNTPVHGRVADVGDEFTVSGNTITGDEGEAVYLIHEWDEEVEAFREENTAKPQSSLSESDMDLPAASDDNFQTMSDDDAPDTEGDTTEAQRAPDDVSEDDFCEMVGEHYDGIDGGDVAALMDEANAEWNGVQMDTLAWFIGDVVDVAASEVGDVLEGLLDASSEDDPDDEQGDKPDMDDDEDEDDDEDDRDLADEVDALRAELAEIRENGGVPPVDSETDTDDADPDAEQDTDEPDETREDSEDSDNTDDTTRATGPDWRA